jgi:hypothetical protein
MINFKVNKLSPIILTYFILMALYWLGLQMSGSQDSTLNLLYSFTLNTLAFLGGVFGVVVSRRWGGAKSALGRGILFMALGLIAWGAVGGYIWSYYNGIFNWLPGVYADPVAAPYPSLADVGFIAAIPLWTVGMFNLAKATGVKYGLRHRLGKAYLLILPILSFVASYYFLVTVARDGVVSDGGSSLKIFFDFAYPVGDIVIITTALLIYGLTLKLLGGIYKWPIHITLLGFVVMFFADMAFSYSTTVETYYNGNYADLLFTIALFLISFGLASFKSPANLHASPATPTEPKAVTAPGVNNG